MTANGFPETASPSVPRVKQAIRAAAVTRSRTTALAIVTVDVLVYGSAILGVLWFTWWPARLVFSTIAGLSIASLFIVAHDACHGGFAPSAAVNRIVGRVCFLPALFPFSPWQHGHNRVHHGWTNLKQRDYGWRPFSLVEYRALPGWRRMLERVYRSTPGVALYSIVEIWWARMVCIHDEDRRSIDPIALRMDRGLVALYAGLGLLIVAPHGVSALLLALLIPWLIFHWLFAIVTLQHHTHPRSRWFKNLEEWSFYEGQVANTVHVVFPKIVEIVLHNITLHGAHHANPKVPLYRLAAAQADLEHAFAPDMIVERWSLSTHRRLFRTCQLYDYEHHRWLAFDGTPTTP